MKRSGKKMRHLLSSVPEPTRLLARSRPIAREGVRVMRHLCRVEALAWWKVAPDASGADADRRRDTADFVQAWTDSGPAWVEIDRRSGAMRVRGWFD